ncbi:hypothetical protein Drorol1_Dr00008889 [Drosera rotundifolia]
MQASDPKLLGFFTKPIPKSPNYKPRLRRLLFAEEPEFSNSLKRGEIMESDDNGNETDDGVENGTSLGVVKPIVCARCHSLRYYGKVKDNEVENLLSDFDFESTVGRKLFDTPGSLSSLPSLLHVFPEFLFFIFKPFQLDCFLSLDLIDENNLFFMSLFQPPIGDKRVEELGKWVRREFHVTGNSWESSSVDIAAAGLGWFAIALKGEAVLGVWTYEGIEVVRRNALLPNMSRYFEEAGFTVSKIVSQADQALNKSSRQAEKKSLSEAESTPHSVPLRLTFDDAISSC